ncbi:MAG: thiol:disulfide interchange protein DsbA/DsbL [Betaproteobacteria bacterium]|jgi:protein dithiol oxidoreductase (disulfide-forming)|nr:thiol:disulfide interchange protein DsbA/DsbL [Betaproteobacteria bacterium]NBP44267.1 thiol:disulfide interchange protein DsbA/DsbL [Betaproteobacteria bacterium]
MERRQFVVSALAACATAPAWSAPEAFKEGKDYLALKQRAPVESDKGKVEVVEFFWYSCPHCNAFEPELNAWLGKLPPTVDFKRVPVRFRADFEPQQRLYYSLDAMGQLPKLHGKVFHAIHVERNPLTTPQSIFEWVAKQGLDRAAFETTFNSFGVAGKAKRAAQLQEAYQVEGVPALGVAGRFYVDGGLAGSMSRALQVVDHLVKQIR